jgi:hypothetical protein
LLHISTAMVHALLIVAAVLLVVHFVGHDEASKPLV